MIVGAAVGGGMAAAQGGNIWLGALAGAISGAFGGFGWANFADNLVGFALCNAAGGALGALVTGGDPGMAAVTAAISSTVSLGLFGEKGIFGSFSGTQTEQYLKQLTASTGVGALMGGISAEIFGGSFGEGAMWGAASAAAGFMLSLHINNFLETTINVAKIALGLANIGLRMVLALPGLPFLPSSALLQKVGNPMSHILWSCRMRRMLGPGFAEWMGNAKEALDIAILDFAKTLRDMGLWKPDGGKFWTELADWSNSAGQPSDIRDNLFGSFLGGLVLRESGDWIPFFDCKCMEKAHQFGIYNPGEGRGTSRPYPPRTPDGSPDEWK